MPYKQELLPKDVMPIECRDDREKMLEMCRYISRHTCDSFQTVNDVLHQAGVYGFLDINNLYRMTGRQILGWYDEVKTAVNSGMFFAYNSDAFGVNLMGRPRDPDERKTRETVDYNGVFNYINVDKEAIRKLVDRSAFDRKYTCPTDLRVQDLMNQLSNVKENNKMKNHTINIFIVNGAPESGKDTLCSSIYNAKVVSVIDPIKNMCDGGLLNKKDKSPMTRKLLSDIYEVVIENRPQMIFGYVVSMIHTAIDQNCSEVFVMARNPRDISRLKDILSLMGYSVNTLLIKRPGHTTPEVNNDGDAAVTIDYDYDATFVNDDTLDLSESKTRFGRLIKRIEEQGK